MKTTKKYTFAALMVAAMSLASSPAYAICDGCVTGAVTTAAATINASIASASAAISGSVNTQGTTINTQMQTNSQMIQQAIGAAATRIEGQVKAGYNSNIDMLATVTDTQNNQNNYREKMRFVAERASMLRGAPCEEVTAVAASAIGQASRGAAGGGASIARDAVTRMTSSISPQADASRKTDLHNQKYCAAGDKACGSPVDAAYQNADLTAATLFTGAAADKKVHLSYDAKQVEASKDYVNNLFKPIATPRLDPETEKTPQGRAYLALHRSETAKVSLARKAADDAAAEADPSNAKINGKPLGAVLKELWKSQGFASDTPVANEISFREMEEIEATRRYASKTWYASIAGTSDTAALLKEMAYMQALEIKQRHDQTKVLKQLALLNSGIYHELVEMNGGPKLAAQRDAAIKSAR
jgi:hypothetical protein